MCLTLTKNYKIIEDKVKVLVSFRFEGLRHFENLAVETKFHKIEICLTVENRQIFWIDSHSLKYNCLVKLSFRIPYNQKCSHESTKVWNEVFGSVADPAGQFVASAAPNGCGARFKMATFWRKCPPFWCLSKSKQTQKYSV